MLKDETALRSILQFVADQSCSVLLEGVRNSQGDVFTACVLQNVGDWQWLVKSGQLKRSYANCQKRPTTAASLPKGICHMCQAGQRDVPWECYAASGLPAWWETRNAQCPFDGSPALNIIPYIPNDRASFYAYDLFHSFHLGVGKSFAAGCLVMASDYMWSTHVDGRMEELSALWITWCEESHEYGILYSLTQSILGWPDRGTYPNGQWSKGAITTKLCLFFEAWASQQDLGHDPLMALALKACKDINACLRALYCGDVWLSRAEASQISSLGRSFLHGYRQLATQSFMAQRALFPHMPKGHSLDHIFSELMIDLRSEHVLWFPNPLNHAVQISEDWVGRTSRLARRTGPPQVILRVLQRVLQACYAHWHAHGFIKD